MARNHNRQQNYRNKLKNVEFLSQNVRGIKSESRTHELFEVLATRNAIAMCIQETWRHGKEVLEYNGHVIIASGLDHVNIRNKRGS